MNFMSQSTITCPECGFSRDEKMPTNSCVYFWECPQCKALIQPKKGDCCVYCSYGIVPCPSVQTSENMSCCS